MEFNVILSGVDSQGGMVFAERIRKTIAGIKLLASRTGYTGEDGYEAGSLGGDGLTAVVVAGGVQLVPSALVARQIGGPLCDACLDNGTDQQ